MSEDAIRSVLIVGNGTVGLAAAIAVRRALPIATVTLIQLDRDPEGWIDRIGAATPIIHHFHRQIGLDRSVFDRRTGAEPIYVRHHGGIGGAGVREASIAAIPFVEGVALHQIWLRHRAETGNASPDFAAVLLALRDARGDDGGLGLRFDAAAYAALLRDMAQALGVVRHDAADIGVETDGTAVLGIATPAGHRLTADLYIDAAGPRSRLLTAMGAAWHDWSSWLPSFLLSVSDRGGGAAGQEAITTTADGPHWVTRQWSAAVAPGGDGSTGRLAKSWQANCAAIGEAAVRTPTLDGSLLGHAIEDILRLIALLPRPDRAGRDRDEYVRRTIIAHDSLADWSSLSIGGFGVAQPEGLRAMLDAFDARGRVAPRELDPIAPGRWLARLMALRPAPRRIDPTALALPDTIIRTTIARAVRR